jgi:hypothetical protein
MMLGNSLPTPNLITFAEPCSMQHRLSLIVAFVVLAVVSCLIGTVLMPSSSRAGEKAATLQSVNAQGEEKTEAQPAQETDAQQPEDEPDSEEKPTEIDTNIDTSQTGYVPVETDMHELMEYIFQPAFKRLKPAMENEPVDNSAWKTIKAEALTLAEGGNLILMRAPEEEKVIWTLHGTKVRGHGRIMYQAAKAKDFKLASQHYRMMLISCNACHYKFAGGEHILTP